MFVLIWVVWWLSFCYKFYFGIWECDVYMMLMLWFGGVVIFFGIVVVFGFFVVNFFF